MTFSSEIMKNNVSTNAICDVLHVQWSLLSTCNYSCSYCSVPRGDENCIFVRERLLSMAHKILELPRSRYVITFTGGEPTLHPHLHELIHYLYSSRRDVHIIIETNGSCEIDYFMPLLNAAPNHTLQINISVHVAFAELPQILTLIAVISDAHQLAHVKLMFDPTCREQVETFRAALTKLRSVVPFTMCIELLMLPSDMSQTDPLYTEADLHWRDMTQRYFAQAAATGPAGHQIAATLPPASEPVSLGFKDFYCCVGTNVLRIDADGRFYSSTCSMVRNNPPLWRATDEDIEGVSYVVKCRAECCAGGINLVLPKFRKLEDAEAYMAAMKQRALELDFQSPPLPNPLRTEPSTKDIVKSRLKRLEPATSRTIESESEPASQQPNPAFIIKHMADICKVYETISDENSRDTFLRDLKVIMTGDASYHKEATYERFTHDKVQEECGDIIADGGKRYCTLLRLEGGDVFARLQAARGVIRQHQPKVQIALLHDTESYIETFLWFLEYFPQYTLYIGYHADHPDETCLYGLPPVLPRKRHLPIPDNIPLPLVSIIVPTYNNEDTLKRCIDSALIQRVDDIEIIIVDDASTDKTPEIIAEYVRRYPKIVRTVRFSENKGAGPARNSGMDMALGKYMAFIDSDDMLATNFLKRGLEVMEAKRADIVAFDMVLNFHNKKQEELWAVEPGTWSGEGSLRQLLLKKAGGYGTYSRLYRTEMLERNNVRYSETRVHQDIFFSVRAFYHSEKTVVIPDVGYYRYVRQGSNSVNIRGDQYFFAFVDFVSFLADFFEDYDIDLESEMYQYCVRSVYTGDRDRVFAAISAAEKEKQLDELLTHERLLQLGKSKEALCCIIADYAILHCHRNGIEPKVDPKDLDWEVAASASRSPKTYTAYGNADIPAGNAPLLSIIVPNYNKAPYLKKCLDSIFTQSMKNFEVIIVDDASNDEGYGILQDYADVHPCVRLYKMDYNCMQGVCRNIGIDLSRGKYITFVDSDDWLEPEFFEISIESMNTTSADIIAFATQDVAIDGSKSEPYWCKPLSAGGVQACRAYWANSMPWGPWAKLFNASFLRNNTHVRFSEGVYHQDVYFMSHATLASKLTVTKNDVVYSVYFTPNSSLRTKLYNYIHIYSSIELILHKGAANKTTSLQDYNFYDVEERMLPPMQAYFQKLNQIAISDNEITKIQLSHFFIKSLLVGYSRCRAVGLIQQGLLPAICRPLTTDYTPPVADPFVSVIIPTYNQEECISRCLDSVLTQSLREIEVIIINDASTDKTLALCEAYAKRDPRVRVYSNDKNRGQGYSRNRALELSRGEFITYVDSDDYILQDFIMRGISFMEYNEQLDIIHFNYTRNTQEGVVSKKEFDKTGFYSGNDFFVLYCKNKMKAWAVWSKIFRATLLKRNHIEYPEYMFEDNFFLMKCYSAARRIFICSECGYVNVITPHRSSAMNPVKITPRHLDGILNLADDIYKYKFEELSTSIACTESCVDVKLQSMLWRFKQFLPYIATFKSTDVTPVTDQNITNTMSCPPLLKEIINDYAKIYAQDKNWSLTLPIEDLDPLSKCPRPADYLIPLSYHRHEKKNIALSVIVPAYNTAICLERCLNSILNQKGDDIEIILIEDSSLDDDTLAICKDYARNYDCIRLFRTPWNSGLGTVRNLAIQQARGKYITFVDSDDWLAPNFLRRGLREMESNPNCDLIDFSWCAWDDLENKQMYAKTMPDGVTCDWHKAFSLYAEGTYSTYAAWAKIYKKDFLISNNISFSACYNEDEFFLLNVYSTIYSMKFSNILSYYYVRNAKNTTIMRPSVRGRKYFESTLNNLRKSHHILSKAIEEGEDSSIYKKKIASYSRGHHRDNLLHYIYACNSLGLPSPLTDEVFGTLTFSKEFMRNLIMDYAVLAQKQLPENKD